MIILFLGSLLFGTYPDHESHVFPTLIWDARHASIPDTSSVFDRDTLLIRLSGANLMRWSKPEGWFKSCPGSFPMMTEHDYDGTGSHYCYPYWYGELINLPGQGEGTRQALGIIEPSHYPLSDQRDSLVMWDSLAFALVEFLTNAYGSCPRFYGYWVSDDDQGYTWPYWNMKYAPAIEAVCARLKSRHLGARTYMYGYGRNSDDPEADSLGTFLGRIPHLDIFYMGPFGGFPGDDEWWPPNNPGYVEKVQAKFNTMVMACCDRLPRVMAADKIPWNHISIVKATGQRRYTEEELRALLSIGLCYGVRGHSFDKFANYDTTYRGIVKGARHYIPYSQESIPGWHYGVDSSDPRDNAFPIFMRAMRDMRSIGPVLAYGEPHEVEYGQWTRWTEWDTAYSHWGSTWWESPGYVTFIRRLDPYEGADWYAELGYFTEATFDPGTGNRIFRDLFMLVNRNCCPGDSTDWEIMLSKERFPAALKTDWYVVDMRNYMYRKLISWGQSSWIFDGNNWRMCGYGQSQYQRNRRALPGDGKLYYVVPWRWDELGGPEPWNVKLTRKNPRSGTSKYGLPTYDLTWFARGDLFKLGPRRRDVDSLAVFITYWNTAIPPGEMQPTEAWGRDDLAAPGCFKYESLPAVEDSGYVVAYTWKPERAGKYYITIHAFNRNRELMGWHRDSIKVLQPGPPTIQPMATGHPAQVKVMDPEGVFHIACTGGMEDTVVQYLHYVPWDTLPIAETLAVGKYPTLVVRHGGDRDTLGIAYLSKHSDTLYYRYRVDSLWSTPAVLTPCWTQNGLSVPRMTLDRRDTVHLSYMLKSQFSSLILYYAKFLARV